MYNVQPLKGRRVGVDERLSLHRRGQPVHENCYVIFGASIIVIFLYFLETKWLFNVNGNFVKGSLATQVENTYVEYVSG